MSENNWIPIVHKVLENMVETASPLQKKVPHYGPMFSGLNHYPKQQIQIDTCDPVPTFMSRRWAGFDRRQPLVMSHQVRYILQHDTFSSSES